MPVNNHLEDADRKPRLGPYGDGSPAMNHWTKYPTPTTPPRRRADHTFQLKVPPEARLPWENAKLTCETCLGDPETAPSAKNACICPECEICGAQGDPSCYGRGARTNHDLQVRPEHRPLIEERRRRMDDLQRQEAAADAEWARLQDQYYAEMEAEGRTGPADTH